MSRPVEPLRRPPLAFAGQSDRTHLPETTLDACRRALELGATGLEADAWLTADGAVVLDDDGVVRRGLRRRPVAELRRDQVGAALPTLEELYAVCGTTVDLSVDVRDPAAAEAVVTVARRVDPGAPKRLWLCHPDWRVLASWREPFPDVHLVNSTRLRNIREGAERRAASLAEAGVDAVNLHYSDWTGGLTTLFHRFELLAFGWDAQHERVIRELVGMGIDGVYSDHVDRLISVLGRLA